MLGHIRIAHFECGDVLPDGIGPGNFAFVDEQSERGGSKALSHRMDWEDRVTIYSLRSASRARPIAPYPDRLIGPNDGHRHPDRGKPFERFIGFPLQFFITGSG